VGRSPQLTATEVLHASLYTRDKQPTNTRYKWRNPLSVATVRRLVVGVQVSKPISNGVFGSAHGGGHSFIVDATTRVAQLAALKTWLPSRLILVDNLVTIPCWYDWTQRCIQSPSNRRIYTQLY